jgi:hypothetical protein
MNESNDQSVEYEALVPVAIPTRMRTNRYVRDYGAVPPARLSECSVCFALVREEHISRHLSICDAIAPARAIVRPT